MHVNVVLCISLHVVAPLDHLKIYRITCSNLSFSLLPSNTPITIIHAFPQGSMFGQYQF